MEYAKIQSVEANFRHTKTNSTFSTLSKKCQEFVVSVHLFSSYIYITVWENVTCY